MSPIASTYGPADAAAVRRSNLSLVLRHLRAHGPCSRTDVAAGTGLNKATVSSLVGELLSSGMVRETGVRRAGTVGRPSSGLEVAGGHVRAIGLELNVQYVSVVSVDLTDRVVLDRRVPCDVRALGPEAVLDELGALAREAMATATRAGARIVGLTVAVPGLVDVDTGTLRFGPNLGWTDVPIAREMSARLPRPRPHVRVDNDGNLAALAEYALGAGRGADPLLYVASEVGVGGGVVLHGRMLRGASGFAGEVGHMPVDTDGPVCGCGRTGCWEAHVGLRALLAALADDGDRVRDPSLDLDDRLAVIRGRAQAGDARTLAALDEVGGWLGFGTAALLDVLNPQAVVFGGYLAALWPVLADATMRQLRRRALTEAVDGCRFSPSEFGFGAAARGAAHVSVEAVFDDPALAARAAGAPVPAGDRP